MTKKEFVNDKVLFLNGVINTLSDKEYTYYARKYIHSNKRGIKKEISRLFKHWDKKAMLSK